MLVSHEFYEEHRQEFLDFGAGLRHPAHRRAGRPRRLHRDGRGAGPRARGARVLRAAPLPGPPGLARVPGGARDQRPAPARGRDRAGRHRDDRAAVAGGAEIPRARRADVAGARLHLPAARGDGDAAQRCRSRSEAPSLPSSSPSRCRRDSRSGSVDSSSSTLASQLDAPVVGLGGVVGVLVVSGFSYLFGRAAPEAGPDSLRPGPRSPVDSPAVGAPDRGRDRHPVGLRRRAPDPGSTPRRAGIVGGAVAIAIVAAVGIYVTGVDHLYSVPTARGWAWDAVIGNVNFPVSRHDRRTARRRPTDRGARPWRRSATRRSATEAVEVLAVRSGGTAPPVLAIGSAPDHGERDRARRPARSRARRPGRRPRPVLGRRRRLRDEPSRRRDLELTVVGVAMPPVLGETDIGEGAVVTLDAVAAAGGDDQPQFVMARFSGDDPGRGRRLARSRPDRGDPHRLDTGRGGEPAPGPRSPADRPRPRRRLGDDRPGLHARRRPAASAARPRRDAHPRTGLAPAAAGDGLAGRGVGRR